jgi:hypothetical protein
MNEQEKALNAGEMAKSFLSDADGYLQSYKEAHPDSSVEASAECNLIVRARRLIYEMEKSRNSKRYASVIFYDGDNDGAVRQVEGNCSPVDLIVAAEAIRILADKKFKEEYGL